MLFFFFFFKPHPTTTYLLQHSTLHSFAVVLLLVLKIPWALTVNEKRVTNTAQKNSKAAFWRYKHERMMKEKNLLAEG